MCEFECRKTGLLCCMECDRSVFCEESCEEVWCPDYDAEMLAMLKSASYRKAKEQGVD